MRKMHKNTVVKLTFSILIAVSFFTITEVSLRILFRDSLRSIEPPHAFISNYQDNPSRIFIEKEPGVYGMNVAAFPSSMFSARFMMPKKSSVYRIFCAGGSSVVGCCGDGKAFPQVMQESLSKDFKDVEVINAGIGAITSSSLVEIVKELVQYAPDCIVLYAGHNDYGYYFWSPDVLKISSSRVKVDELLNRLYLYRFLLKTFGKGVDTAAADEPWAKYPFHFQEEAREEYFRRLDAFKGIIPSQKWFRFAQNEIFHCESLFENNVLEISSILRESGIKLVICTVVSNIRDYPPVFSFHSPDLDQQALKEWKDTHAIAKRLLDEGRYDQALSTLLRLRGYDTLYAETYYFLGKVYLALGRHRLAQRNFILARDLSPAYAPFQRAPSSLNAKIRKLCKNNGILLIDIEEYFYLLEDNFGIPGYDLFGDNLHPNPEGYRLIGERIAQGIKSFGIIPKI